jgi:hypothetical protein
VFKPDSTGAHDRSDVTPIATTTASVGETPPPLPTTRKKLLSNFAITTICVGATLAALVVIGVATAIIGGLMTSQVHAVQARPEPQRPAAPAQRPTAPREERAARPAPANDNAGITYRNHKITTDDGQPVSLHILKIDRSRADLGFYSAHARDKVLAVSFIKDQAAAVPPEVGTAIAGINGDFYVRDQPTYAGDPRGLQIMNGELISAPDTVCVWFDTNGAPHLDEVKGLFYATWPDGRKTPFGLNQQRRANTAVLYTPTLGTSTRATGGSELVLEKEGDGPWLPLQAGQAYRARIREVSITGNTKLAPDTMVLSIGAQLLADVPELKPGTVLQLSTGTTPNLAGVKAAIAGGPALIKAGQAFTLKSPPPGAPGGYAEASKYQRHPRAAVGWSPSHIYLIIADGRKPGLSMGMKLAELAEYFVSLGCTDAMNLDGGKSAQLWFNNDIVNDAVAGEDTVANSLLVIRKPAAR